MLFIFMLCLCLLTHSLFISFFLICIMHNDNKLITLQKRSPNIIIGGDFNLLGIDWETWQTGCTNKSQHEVLLDFFLNNSLSQVQISPT